MEDVLLEWFARIDGQLGFRLLLQPLVAIVLGCRDGIRDWENADPHYFWELAKVLPEERRSLVTNGLLSMGKVTALAFGLDCLFQYLVTSTLSVAGALGIAIAMALAPYLLARGASNRWRTRLRGRHSSTGQP